jgi:hypothetical protein
VVEEVPEEVCPVLRVLQADQEEVVVLAPMEE